MVINENTMNKKLMKQLDEINECKKETFFKMQSSLRNKGEQII